MQPKLLNDLYFNSLFRQTIRNIRYKFERFLVFENKFILKTITFINLAALTTLYHYFLSMENHEKLENDFVSHAQNAEIASNVIVPKTILQEVLRFTLYFLCGLVLSEVLTFLFQRFSGVDIVSLVSGKESANFNIGQRNILRALIFMNQIFLIGLPAFLTLRWVYKTEWFKTLGLNKRTNQFRLFLAVLMLIASAPCIYFLEEINKSVNLPAWMKSMEQSQDGLLNVLFSKEYSYEMVLTFILVAAIPAFCEELLFRGWLQPLMKHFFSNDHAAVWVTAIIFSAIHFQFEGFAARAALGAMLGYLFVWTKSLWYSIFVHFFNNGAQLFALYTMNLKPEEMNKLDPGDSVHWTIAGLSLVSVLFLGTLIRDLSNGVQFFKFDDTN